ncbi:MAG: RNA polymerase sigma factor, partial [Trebonia sp.]
MDSNARFLLLFQEAYPALRRYALHRGLTAQDADDLVADTLEIAWRRLDEVPVGEPLPWLYGVARNVMRNRHRKDGRHALLFSRLTRLRA